MFILSLLLACTPAPVTIVAPSGTPSRQVSVTGTARLEVQPDEAIIDFQLTGTASSMKSAHKAADTTFHEFQRAMKTLGIPDTDITTGGTLDSPNYRWDGQRVYNYRSTMSLTVKTRDFEQVAAIVDAAVASGVTEASVRYEVSDMPAHKKKARDMATAAAREKAEQLAKNMGASLGAILTVSEGTTPSWGYGNVMAQSSAREESDRHSGYAPDAEALTLTIQAVFALQ